MTFKYMVDYGVGVKVNTYFKLMYICGNHLVVTVFGVN